MCMSIYAFMYVFMYVSIQMSTSDKYFTFGSNICSLTSMIT